MSNDSYKAIKAEIKRLQQQAQVVLKKEKQHIILSIIKSMHEFDISLKELEKTYIKHTPAHLRLSDKRTVPIKYRNEETGEAWSGRGKLPRWIVQAQQQGISKESFLVKD